MWYYATEGSNAEDDIDTEGIFRRIVLIQRVVVERMVQKVSYIALLP